MLEIGIKAPEFTLQNQDGKKVSLTDYLGKKVILYFYPKDDTPGCTSQACGFTQLYPDFKEKGAEIIGISKDTVKSHKKFADKYNLTFTLLADTETKVVEAYDVWKEKSMYGKKYMGIVRTTYLIDEEGMIIKAFDQVNAAKNPEEMLDNLS
ncbi:MAG: thioredoxin-dependent thiol peroxidase [Firmicutes bacterium HGW-Firmicutes-3]|jgi:peroxiredoxin Q/BCP|nr:MAG: thioredoxin-dependent thiol peroxidase [Firmicutes bacterium HGW-Firmicutes-3]